MSAIRVAYIRSLPADLFWFLTLPFVGIAFAITCQNLLSVVALASVNLWITVPHHFGTWCRTYGLREDWERFRTRLILGPVVIVVTVALGLAYFPLTIFLVTLLWDQQHSVMQQHGLARIYDFKAGAGDSHTGRVDLWLNIVLFGNLLVTAPLWTEIWVHQLYIWNLPVSASAVRLVHATSYAVTATFTIFYLAYITRTVVLGHKLNPLKYLFLGSSYLLWYYTSWHTNSALVFGIAHRLMHGLQYLVVVYWYLQNKERRAGQKPWMFSQLSGLRFAGVGLLYAFLFQLLLLRPLDEFGFGIASVLNPPDPLSLDQSMSAVNRTYDLYAASIINSTALLHYYFDSFIWKVRDEKTQQGL